MFERMGIGEGQGDGTVGVSGENVKRLMTVGSKGFTVLEVLVTLGILGLILGMAVPRYVVVRQKAEARACQARRSLVERVIRVEQGRRMETGVRVLSMPGRRFLRDVVRVTGRSGWKETG